MTTAAIAVTPIVGRARGVVRRGLVLSLSLDGVVAVGEASPLPGRSRESLEDVVAALRSLGPRLEIDLARPMDAVDRALPASLRFALEIAASRLAHALRGGPTPTPAVETQVLGDDLGSIEAELDALSRGARSFKLKIRSAKDVDRVIALRQRAPDARLRVDANRAFARARDVPWDALRTARIEWIEEPTPDAATLDGTPVPIALDESIEDDRERALEAVHAGRVAAIVLKPTLLGAREVLGIAEIARARGVHTIVSHAFESEVGLLAALELAAKIAPGECHGLGRWAGIESFGSEESRDAAPQLV